MEAKKIESSFSIKKGGKNRITIELDEELLGNRSSRKVKKALGDVTEPISKKLLCCVGNATFLSHRTTEPFAIIAKKLEEADNDIKLIASQQFLDR